MRLFLVPFLSLVVAVHPLFAQDAARGIQLYEAHDFAGAKVELTAALRRNARDPRAHYYLGRIAMLDNDADVAADHFERATKLADTVSAYHLWYATASAQQASRVTPLKRPMLAQRMKAGAERAVALDGRNVDARDLLLDFYSMAPGVMGGGIDKAREQAGAIAQIDPVRGHLAAARLAIQAGDTAAVEREMNVAIAGAPDSLRAYTALTTWYVTTKQWSPAFATIDRYLARHPDDLSAAYQIGRIAAMSGQQLTRGEDRLRAFIANPPKDAGSAATARAHLRLGQVLQQQGRSAEARSAFEQALRIDPRNEEAMKALKAGGQ
jgi:tetratricopeptide (TPR) repeat protein